MPTKIRHNLSREFLLGGLVLCLWLSTASAVLGTPLESRIVVMQNDRVAGGTVVATLQIRAADEEPSKRLHAMTMDILFGPELSLPLEGADVTWSLDPSLYSYQLFSFSGCYRFVMVRKQNMSTDQNRSLETGWIPSEWTPLVTFQWDIQTPTQTKLFVQKDTRHVSYTDGSNPSSRMAQDMAMTDVEPVNLDLTPIISDSCEIRLELVQNDRRRDGRLTTSLQLRTFGSRAFRIHSFTCEVYFDGTIIPQQPAILQWGIEEDAGYRKTVTVTNNRIRLSVVSDSDNPNWITFNDWFTVAEIGYIIQSSHYANLSIDESQTTVTYYDNDPVPGIKHLGVKGDDLGYINLAPPVMNPLELRAVVNQNEQLKEEEFILELQARGSSRDVPRTLYSLSCELFFEAAETHEHPDTTVQWFFTSSLGYSHHLELLPDRLHLSLQGDDVNKDGGGSPTGVPIDNKWTSVMRIHWNRVPPVMSSIAFDETSLKAGFFEFFRNDPRGNVLEWPINGHRVESQSYAVELAEWRADVLPGEVELHWSTQSETDNLGFLIYRSTSEEGVYTQLFEDVIPGATNSEVQRSYSYRDQTVQNGQVYYYKLADVDVNGIKTFHKPLRVVLQEGVRPLLRQNVPNPFNGDTRISFVLPHAGTVDLSVYNIRGQKVKQLIQQDLPAGHHDLIWNGGDDFGNTVSSGIYFAILRTRDHIERIKMNLIR